MTEHGQDARPWAASRQSLADQLGQIDGVLPGSLVVRHLRCGKAGCACKADARPPFTAPTSSGPGPSRQDRDPLPQRGVSSPATRSGSTTPGASRISTPALRSSR